MGDVAGFAAAGEQDVQIAVVVVIAPDDRAVQDVLQPRADVGEESAFPAVHLGAIAEIGGLAGQQDVQVAVVVVVAPGDRAVHDPRQPRADVGEGSLVVAVHDGNGVLVVGAGKQDVQVAVVVVIAPVDRTAGNPLQPRSDVGERPRIVAVDPGDMGDTDTAGEQDVQVAVVVVVAPGGRALDNPLQPRADVGEDPRIVAVNLGDGAGIAAAGQQNVQIAVAVVVAPGGRAFVNPLQTRADVGEDPRIVAVYQGDTEKEVVHAGEQDVQIAVAVVIAPDGRTVPDPSETRDDVGEDPRIVAVHLGDTAGTAVAGQQDVQVAVVVVVAPGGRPDFDPIKARADVGEGSRVVAIRPGDKVGVVVLAGQQDVQVAVFVVVAPDGRTVPNLFQPRADVGEGVLAQGRRGKGQDSQRTGNHGSRHSVFPVRVASRWATRSAGHAGTGSAAPREIHSIHVLERRFNRCGRRAAGTFEVGIATHPTIGGDRITKEERSY